MTTSAKASFFSATLWLAALFFLQAKGQEGCAFRAAAYQKPQRFYPTADPLAIMAANLDEFEGQVGIAASQGAQIIVFPEYGVTGLGFDVDDPFFYQQLTTGSDTPWIPCDDPANLSNLTMVAYRLSCMAREHEIIVVANFPTHVSNGSEDFRYNTDAVFGAEGALVATYYKMNLYGEEEFDRPPDDPTHFDTPFGRFGLLTCFDLLWPQPLTQLLRGARVDTLLFPTAWQDQLPYLASVQAQAAWAHGLDVNLVAANVYFPLEGFLGSGLYSGAQGPALYTYDSAQVNGTLLVADLPCHRNASSSWAPPQLQPEANSTVHYIKHQDLQGFVSLALNETSGYRELCQEGLCCRVTYQASDIEGYLLVVHKGNVSEGDLYTYSAEICSLLHCPDLTLASCGAQPYQDIASVFTQLTLEANTTVPDLFPSVLQPHLLLLPQLQWNYQQYEMADGNYYSKLTVNDEPFTPFAVSIYARNYAEDP